MGIICHNPPIDKGIDVLISKKQHTEENLTMCKKLIQSRQPLHLQIQYVLEKNDQNLLIVQETPGVTLREFFKRHNSQFFVDNGKKVLYVTPLFQRLLSCSTSSFPFTLFPVDFKRNQKATVRATGLRSETHKTPNPYAADTEEQSGFEAPPDLRQTLSLSVEWTFVDAVKKLPSSRSIARSLPLLLLQEVIDAAHKGVSGDILNFLPILGRELATSHYYQCSTSKPTLELPILVHFIVAACESMISGTGMRLGDIVTASNGKTMEELRNADETKLLINQNTNQAILWEAFEVQKNIWKEIESGKTEKVVKKTTKNKNESCPYSISLSGSEFSDHGRILVLPCGLTFGSHITIVRKPTNAHPEHDPKISLLKNE
ncbi:hypothetical protein Vadar_012561 [Vaccinium darrowii]|uniref:Uncharacterized protein n=1 Tax=Vaccinium darrowii TaxID=229202 RepID=A0ACB7XZX1_9ERIC|nr:hypothetical protein Vadar_012561 [Vaccinium darrowii]